jgi:hypothetical protein
LWVSTPKVDVPSVLQDVRADGWEATGALATQDWLAARRAAPRCGLHLPLQRRELSLRLLHLGDPRIALLVVDGELALVLHYELRREQAGDDRIVALAQFGAGHRGQRQLGACCSNRKSALMGPLYR